MARSFGFALLDRGAVSINMPSFKYYDRMYPSQDVLSKIGNLVALPLQGRALENGNSAFIDENWNAYPDQWETLRSIRKIPEQEIISFIHYPPFYKQMVPNEINFENTLKEYGIKRCYYAHLHGEGHKEAIEGILNGIRYQLVSSDYLNFDLIQM